MLERTYAIWNEVLEPIRFVLAYPTVLPSNIQAVYCCLHEPFNSSFDIQNLGLEVSTQSITVLHPGSDHTSLKFQLFREISHSMRERHVKFAEG